MTIKQLAFETQQHLQAQTGTIFKRSHVYELLAAAFGFNSYASLCAKHIFTQGGLPSRHSTKYAESAGRRCLELDYPPETALKLVPTLSNYLADQDIGVIRIADIVAYLQYETYGVYETSRVDDLELDEFDDDAEDAEEDIDSSWPDFEFIVTPVLLDGLTDVAEKGNADAHYALALIYGSSYDPDNKTRMGSDYWYNEERNGRVLSGIQKEWAESYAALLSDSEKYEHHLRAAGAQAHEAALLEMAERFDDPSFFEKLSTYSESVDATRAADIAENLGLHMHAWRWKTKASEQGNTVAMRELIETYDIGDQPQCWTWFYLAKLLGTDLSKDEYRAFHEDGSNYDDDIGGPLYVEGRDGVRLKPIGADEDAAAQQAATTLYQSIVTRRALVRSQG